MLVRVYKILIVLRPNPIEFMVEIILQPDKKRQSTSGHRMPFIKTKISGPTQ